MPSRGGDALVFRIEISPEVELRVLEESDAPELFALTEQNRAQLRKWLPWVDQTRCVEDTRRFIARALGRLVMNNGFACGIWHRDRLAGSIELHQIDWNNRASSIGYWLAAEFQGRGIMTAACRAVTDFAFRRLDLNRLEIRCATGNRKSCAIPERLGFRREGVLRDGQWVNDRFLDLAVYGLLAREWRG